MTTESTPAVTPRFIPGDVVTRTGENIGIVTDVVKKSGPNKGRLGVMWAGAPWEVSEWPEGLVHVRVGIEETLTGGA
jgi:hypothetical protein